MITPIETPEFLPSDFPSDRFSAEWREPRRSQPLPQKWRNRGRIVVLTQQIITLESEIRNLRSAIREVDGEMSSMQTPVSSQSSDNDTLELPVPRQTVTARVVSSEVAPFKWAEDEPESDEILHFSTPKVRRRARVNSSRVAPFKWVSDDE